MATPLVRRRRGLIKRKTLSIAFFLGVIGLAVLTWSPPLRIQTMLVSGNHFVTLPMCERVLTPYLGRSFFWTWVTGSLTTSLHSSFPQIQSVSLRLGLSGSLSIRLKEKTPILFFSDHGRSLLVALDGTILRRETDQMVIPSSEELFIVKGSPLSLFDEKSMDPILVKKLVYMMLQVKTYLPNMQFQLDLNHHYGPIDIAQLRSLELLKDDTLPIMVGAFERLDQKFKCLRYYFDEVVPSLKTAKPINYIDLRVPGKVIVKYES